MKLFYAPGTCSLGIHVLLEQAGAPYELQPVAVREQEQYGAAYRAINPKSKVPALERDDGSVLTEFGAIAAWIARSHPAASLIPNDAEGEARAWELLEYCVATIHMQGYTRMVRPSNFSPSAADHEAVRARGREIFTAGLDIVDGTLPVHPASGPVITVGDAALFYVCCWAHRAGIALPPRVAAHFAHMRALPAVQRTLAAEGITL